MKWHALLLSVLCVAPSVALAQQGPPPGGDMMQGPSSARRADMQKMMQMHEAFRQQVLAAITPAHKALLAKVVGDLAVASNPDDKAAAAQLNAVLSTSEKQAILSAASQFHDQMKAQMQNMRDQRMAQWQSAHPNMTPPPMKQRPGGMGQRKTPDAGTILLMVGRGHDMMMGGGRGMGGGSPRH